MGSKLPDLPRQSIQHMNALQKTEKSDTDPLCFTTSMRDKDLPSISSDVPPSHSPLRLSLGCGVGDLVHEDDALGSPPG